MKKGLVSLIFIIVASTIYSQTLKNYCDTARNYIIDGKQPCFVGSAQGLRQLHDGKR